MIKNNIGLWKNTIKTDFNSSLIIIGIVSILPVFVSSTYYLGIIIVGMYFSILALAWNLLAGFAGQFSLAPAAFAMLGAYVPALLNYHLSWNVYSGLLLAVLLTGCLGYVLGKIVLRLEGPYLALTTLAFAEILRLIIGNSINLTRGDQGINVPTFTQSRYIYYFLFVLALLAVLVFLYRLMTSKVGYFLLSIRDDPIGAESRGVDTVFFKTIVFAISCALCGMAGALYGTFSQLASPELGLISQTGIVIAMVIIGGIGSLTGSILGALIVYIGSEYIRVFGDFQMIVFSAMVIIFARFLSKGIWGYLRTFLIR